MRLRRARLTAIVTTVVSAVLLAAGTTVGVAAAQSAGGDARASVPWDRVGAGWVLAQYASAPPEGGSGPAALYLISPGGTRYQLAGWPDWRFAPQLAAWSPDGKRALFQVFSGKGGVEQLTLATGHVSTFVLQGDATPIGYTTPHGLNIVAGLPAFRYQPGPVQPVRQAGPPARLLGGRPGAVHAFWYRVRHRHQLRPGAGRQQWCANPRTARSRDEREYL